jgi:sulfur carrier protein
MWYIKYHYNRIVGVRKSPYLCTVTKNSEYIAQKTEKNMSKITVNGEAQEIEKPLSVAELIVLNKVLQPEMVSVQVNEEFIDRPDYEKTILKDGDSIDFLYFMGGGQEYV